MTPFQYVDLFHNLTVSDSRLGLNALVKVTGYPDGTEWNEGSVAMKEAYKVLNKLTQKPTPKVKGEFSIPNNPGVDPTELFYPAGIVRAFCGRGSPNEMRDALRLAVASGVCPLNNATPYGQFWFKQDCNAFVGNYLGASPMLGIPAYAKGLLPGSSPSEHDCMGLIPRKPRTSLSQVSAGDLILTYGSPHPKHTWRWRHIALVENITVGTIPTRSGTDKHGVEVTDAKLSIAEWGWKIEADHKVENKDITILEDLLKCNPEEYSIDKVVLSDLKGEMHGQKLVGFVGKDPSKKKAFRIFFEGFTPSTASHRGYHCNGVYGH